MAWRTGVWLGGADPLGAPGPFDTVGAHESGDLVATDVVATTVGGLPDLAGPVDAVVVLPELTHDRGHDGVALDTGGGWRFLYS
ncbi:hypothetical protein Pve01_91700 [Planomonospora venezuelensis]|nr:hypothetical protein Pve01_91700 [Planomonospora venezuelensis]